jgi:hypothetical protein
MSVLVRNVRGVAVALVPEPALDPVNDPQETYRLLVAGEISEYVASLVVTETRHLDPNARRDFSDGAAECCGVCP